MFKNERNTKAIYYIMDTFAGADGGITFLNFKIGMEKIESEGSESGDRLMEIMRNFSKLIAILQK